MAEEKEALSAQQKKKSGIAIVFGCALTAIAMNIEGPMQWVTFAVAIAMLAYGVFLGSKQKRSKPVE